MAQPRVPTGLNPRLLTDAHWLDRRSCLGASPGMLDTSDAPAHEARTTDADIHLRYRNGRTVGAVPLLEVIWVSPHCPDQLNRRIEAALDYHRVPSVVVSHGRRLPFLAVGVGRGTGPCGRIGPARPADTVRPRRRLLRGPWRRACMADIGRGGHARPTRLVRGP